MAKFAPINALIIAAILSLALGETCEAKSPDGGARVPLGRQQEAEPELKQSGGSSKPDLWLGWMNWKGAEPMKPFLTPIQSQLSQFTGPMSEMILQRVPGADSAYQQFDQAGNQLSGLMNPMQFVQGMGIPGMGGQSKQAEAAEAAAEAGN